MLEYFKFKLKKIIEKIPFWPGFLFSYIPDKLLFGSQYKSFQNEITIWSKKSNSEKKAIIFDRVQSIVNYAYNNIPFYKDFYDSKGFTIEDLRQFSDIEKIPITRKEDFKSCNLENRSSETILGGVKINTGGTSGEPLEFYVESSAFSREWAHMYTIWSKLGYSRTDLKLTFRGKNLGSSAIHYNPINNEYLVNTYLDIGEVSKAIHKLTKKREIKYLHGYPSAIYEFSKYIEENNPKLVKILNSSLKGVFLASEYPAEVYRSLINRVFEVNDISWYGHSEMCILAYEKNSNYLYEPFHTYGYCEAVSDQSGDFSLIGTSYYNTCSPFIRYNTGDLVNPNFENGLLKSFEISSGRIGEYVQDKNGQNISLTSLIFGRHHDLFGKAKFIQIGQDEKGKATIYVTPVANGNLLTEDIRNNFDSTNVNIEFSYCIVDEPFKSKAGKIPLLVDK